MKRIRGRWLALSIFAGIVVLVTGGLAWVTRAALRLEHADIVRLALWQLDSRMFPVLAREDSRPVAQYEPLYPAAPAVSNQGKPIATGEILIPTPLLTAELPEWINLHFVVDSKFGWRSPVVLGAALEERLKRAPANLALTNAIPMRATILEELRNQYPVDDLLAKFGIPVTAPTQAQQQLDTAGQVGPQQGATIRGQAMDDSDVAKRSAQQSTVRNESKGLEGSNSAAIFLPLPGKKSLWEALPGADASYTCQTSYVDAMKPHWLRGKDGQERLMFIRSVRSDGFNALQGVQIDWPTLREELLKQVRDLLPDAELMSASNDEPNDVCMTALPVRLVTGAATMFILPLSTPMRWGLLLAWSAAAFALAMTALGGWSLYDLSERRFRFVSAVTHELRTPLTSMRLFLDMLTSGMVRESKQRDEYLKILDQESDRLNRLIGNVLDYARLERHKPVVRRRPVSTAELMETVRNEWDCRCRNAGKELVVEAHAGVPTQVITDPELCRQLLGNLIDNACKYSRDSADPRVLFRATADNGTIAFEVEDKGPGVPIGEARSLFRPFRRGAQACERAGGIGLGLALANRWAILLGGRLRLKPGHREGACFQFLLPASEAIGK